LQRDILPKNYKEPRIFPKGSGWNKDQYGPLVIPKKGDVVKLTPENIEIYRTLINRTYKRKVVEVKGNDIFIDGKKQRNIQYRKIIILQWEIIVMIVPIADIGDLFQEKKLLVKL
jgi:hypothetical protein